MSALLTAGACVGVGYKIVRPVVGIMAQSDYRKAADVYNADLRSRINDNVAGEVAPPPPAPAPATDSAPPADAAPSTFEEPAPPPPEELEPAEPSLAF